MHMGKGVCVLLLYTHAVEATLSPVEGVPKIFHGASQGFREETHLFKPTSVQQMKGIFKHADQVPSEAVKEHESIPVNLVDDVRGCPQYQRRSLVLIRRGCVGGIAKGLSATANGLSKSAARLQRFDKFFSPLTFRQKLAWFARKGYNGGKHTVKFGVKGVVFLVKMLKHGAIKTGRGAWVVMRGTWHVAKHTTLFALKLVGLTVAGIFLLGVGILRGTWEVAKFAGYTVPIHSWKYLGKGLAATGRGFQKAGNRMQAQSASQLSKKVPRTQ